MPLHSIQLTDFRCLRQVELELDPTLTLITGPNGAGKTSLLEGIYLLGRGRSFRTPDADSLIRQGAEKAIIVGHNVQNGRRITIGIELSDNSTRARIAGAPAETLAELSLALPVQVIEPGIHKLVEEGPLRRRRYLDWGVFHVEHAFLPHWQRFNRALQQRNAALRAGADDATLDVWTREFVASGEAVHEARSRYVAELLNHVGAVCQALLGETIALSYHAGWRADRSLEAALSEARERDRQRLTTTAGPHRADLSIRRLSRVARQTVSRGQQKLLAASLLLGQLRLHAERQQLETVLLLDDPAAELDRERLAGLIEEVHKLPAQLVITALHDDFRPWGTRGRLFHVEQGQGVQLI